MPQVVYGDFCNAFNYKFENGGSWRENKQGICEEERMEPE